MPYHLCQVIVAKPRDADDHIQWLLEQGRQEDALEAVRALHSMACHPTRWP